LSGWQVFSWHNDGYVSDLSAAAGRRSSLLIEEETLALWGLLKSKYRISNSEYSAAGGSK